MRRVKRPVVTALAALTCALLARSARAQNCESTRPTDAGGTAGVSYGTAKVAFVDSPSGRARVHYALSGPSAPPAASTLQAGVPDAAVVAARAADEALDKYAALKFLPPLSDGDSPCASNGDSDAVDIYLINFAAADGQAVLDHCSAGKPKTCAGFVLVENDFRSGGYADTAEGLRTVVPHELFHLVQDAYAADVEHWWAEGSAQWAAKQVYPELHDLERFLPAYFDIPWQPLDVPPNGVITSFLYATAIWPVFLHERFDAAVVREVFEGFDGTSGVLGATDQVLQARGSSLAGEFLQFAAYNSATGARAPDRGGYEHAADYPEVPFEALDTAKDPLVSDVTAGMGATYYSLSAAQPLQISLEADPSRLAALLVPIHDGKPSLEAAQPLPAQARGDAVIVLAGQSTLRTDAAFKLRATSSTDAAPESSGCSVSGRLDTTESVSAFWLGMALSGLAALRARSRRRTVRKGEI
jgi:hypothetical protein